MPPSDLSAFEYRACTRKRGYPTDAEAKAAAGRIMRKFGGKVTVYRCQICRLHHITGHSYTAKQRAGFRAAGRAIAQGKK